MKDLFRVTSRLKKMSLFKRDSKEKKTSPVKSSGSKFYTDNGEGASSSAMDEEVTDQEKMRALYEEALYSIMHRVGKSDLRKEDLYFFLKSAFGLDDETHYELLKKVGQEKVPQTVLCVGIERAEGLSAKDPNGFSDPYCMFGIQPAGAHYEGDCNSNQLPAKEVKATAVKKTTLDPVWNENFLLDVDDLKSDLFHLDIWDQDEEKQNFLDAASKMNEISGIRGLGRYFKQVTESARKGTQTDDFLGCVNFPLKEVPGAGMYSWMNLEARNNRSTVQGRLKLSLSISCRERRGVPIATESSEDNEEAVKNYQDLLTVFAEQQLQHTQDSSKWSCFIPNQGTSILDQISVQNNLSRLQRAISKWVVFSRINSATPLDFGNLLNILSDVDKEWLRADKRSITQERSLGNGLNNFIAYCLKLVGKHRDIFPQGTAQGQHNMSYMLKCLSLILRMRAFRTCCPDKEGTLKPEVERALKEGTDAWVKIQIAHHQPLTPDNNDRIQGFIDILNEINNHLEMGEKYYNERFLSDVGVPYTKIVFEQIELSLDSELSSEIKRVIDLMDGDSAWAIHGPDPEKSGSQNMRAGTKLYELYITVQQVVLFRRRIPNYVAPKEELSLHTSYKWFSDAVQNWFLMAKEKSKNIIKNAFDLDLLKPLDKVKHSSSAVDTSGCVIKIKNFWKELDWPDKSESYPLIIKILEAICECAMYYAKLCHSKLDNAGYFDIEGQFDVCEEVCVILTNIEYVRQFINTLSKDLHIKDVLEAIEKSDGEGSSAVHRRAIEAMIKSTDDDVVNKILMIIHGLADKMRADMKKAVFRMGWSSKNEGVDKALEPMYTYLEENLYTTYNKLDRINFYRVMQGMWRVILEEVDALLCTNRGEEVAFYNRVNESLDKMADHIHNNDEGLSLQDVRNQRFKDLQTKIDLMKAPSKEIIEKYFVSRMETQNNRIDALREGAHPFGFLMIRAGFYALDNQIYIHVMRARNLLPLDSGGFSDPFCKMELFPKHSFNQPSQKTKVHKKTLSPVFAEEFTIKAENLEIDEVTGRASVSDAACVRFSLIDHDLMSGNDFEGECFLAIKDLPLIESMGTVQLQSIEPVEMPLSEPSKDDELLLILAARKWDSQGCSFAKDQFKREICLNVD